MPSVPTDYRPLDGSERRPAPGARLLGPADPDETLIVTLHLRSPTQANIDLVTQFAKSQGLSTVEANAARRTVIVAGTVKKMSQAFAVELGSYETPTGRYRGREGFIYLPAHLLGVVDGVFGLDNRPVARRRNAPAEPLH